jgi:hypothetical protein
MSADDQAPIPFEETLTRHPLIRFSIYTHLQVEIVREIAAEILALLDSLPEGSAIDARVVNRAYGRFWLWVLAAFEVTRTMKPACFSGRLNERLGAFRRRVVVMRAPFTKQQLAGKKLPINAEASIAAWQHQGEPDFAFKVGDDFIWVRPLLAEFEDLVSSIKPDDILLDLRDAPSKR